MKVVLKLLISGFRAIFGDMSTARCFYLPYRVQKVLKIDKLFSNTSDAVIIAQL